MSKLKIAVDAGHGQDNRALGRFDPGATAYGRQEADISLMWATEVARILRNMGLETWLTRSSSHDSAPLGDVYSAKQRVAEGRVRRALAAGCTHYLSLHCDGSDNPAARGTEAIYRTQADKEFAALVLDAALPALGLPERGLKTEAATAAGRLAVMEFPGPVTLLETGFITNLQDADAISQVDRARQFAVALGLKLGGKLPQRQVSTLTPEKLQTLPGGSRLFAGVKQLQFGSAKLSTPHGVWIHDTGETLYVRPVEAKEL